MNSPTLAPKGQARLSSAEELWRGTSGADIPLLSTGTLFAGKHEIAIAHGNEVYRLRLTRQNRLILTK